MNKASSVIASVTLILMAIVAMLSCARTPTVQLATPTPAPPVATAKQEAEVRTLTFEQPRLKVSHMEWWPVEVVNVAEAKRGKRNGDWIIEIRNVSDKRIEAIRLLLDPPNCDAFVMSPGLWVGFGKDDPYFIKPLNMTLEIGKSGQIAVERERLDKVFSPKALAECSPEKSYFSLFLERVKYSDGTVWKAVRDPDDPNREH